MAACNDQAGVYLSSYPSGRYRANVEEWVIYCRSRLPQPPPPPPQPNTATLQRRALEQLQQYYRVHSSSANAGVREFEALYKPVVRFYNSPIDRTALAYKKVSELRSYPERRYQIREDTFNIQCDQTQRSCRLRGVVVGNFIKVDGMPTGGPFTTIISFADLDGPWPQVAEECAETPKNKVTCF